MDAKKKEALLKSYTTTTYSVFLEKDKQPEQKKEQVKLYIGKSLPYKINNLMNCQGVNKAAILTAWNPKSKLLSENENRIRNTALQEKLVAHGALTYPAIGQGIGASWPGEESFLVFNITTPMLNEVAIEFGQFAYVLLALNKTAELVYTPLWFN